jgi:hypothetical protein
MQFLRNVEWVIATGASAPGTSPGARRSRRFASIVEAGSGICFALRSEAAFTSSSETVAVFSRCSSKINVSQ